MAEKLNLGLLFFFLLWFPGSFANSHAYIQLYIYFHAWFPASSLRSPECRIFCWKICTRTSTWGHDAFFLQAYYLISLEYHLVTRMVQTPLMFVCVRLWLNSRNSREFHSHMCGFKYGVPKLLMLASEIRSISPPRDSYFLYTRLSQSWEVDQVAPDAPAVPPEKLEVGEMWR